MRVIVTKRTDIDGFIEIIQCVSSSGNKVIVREHEDGSLEFTKILKSSNVERLTDNAQSIPGDEETFSDDVEWR